MNIPYPFNPLGVDEQKQLELTSADFVRTTWSEQELNALGRTNGPNFNWRPCMRQNDLGVLYFGYNWGRTGYFDDEGELLCYGNSKVIPPRPSEGEVGAPVFECWSLDKPRKFKVELSLSRDDANKCYAYQTLDGWQTWEPILFQKDGTDVYLETTECQSFCFIQRGWYVFYGKMQKMIVS